MTYLEYSQQVMLELTRIKQHSVLLYNKLKGEKGYLNFDERDLYMEKVEEFHTLADQCIYVQSLMLEGGVDPFDHID